MRLGQSRDEFGKCLGLLLVKMYADGYTARVGDVYSAPDDLTEQGMARHKKGSQHNKALAVDINLFLNGKFLSKTEDHKIFGEYWESLHPNNRWGGRYTDGNHYETLENGFKR